MFKIFDEHYLVNSTTKTDETNPLDRRVKEQQVNSIILKQLFIQCFMNITWVFLFKSTTL